MKYQEYDSPFDIVMSDITTQIARDIDEKCWQAVQMVGIDVKKETLLLALEHDSARYREAFNRGRETGYTEREEEIVRCKYCMHARIYENCVKCENAGNPGMFATYHRIDWFCADGERKVVTE